MDRTKAQILHLQLWLSILLLTEAGLIGWFFNHVDTSGGFRMAMALVVMIVIGVACWMIDNKIAVKILQLKDD